MQVVLLTECNGAPGWGRDAGCYAVADQLRKAGFSTQVVDFFSFADLKMQENIINQFVDDSTLMVGFSSTHFSSYRPDDFEFWMSEAKRTEKNGAWNTYFPLPPEAMSNFFKKIKQVNSGIKVVVGGQKVVQKRKLQEKHPDVDLWVEGMADTSIVEICSALEKGGWKSRKRVSSEDEFPPFAGFNVNQMSWSPADHLFSQEALPLEISRGCPFNCSFCDYKKKKKGTWIKNEDTLHQELISNYDKFGITHYMITDFLVNEDIEKMQMIHRVFTSLPFKVEWSGFGRLDLLLKWPEMIDLIYESGAKSVMWGIESVRKEVGAIIGKNCDLEKLTPLLEKCRRAWGDEIITGSGFIVGLPGETVETADDLMNWILDSKQYLHGFEVTPLFIGSYNPEKESRIDFSKIQRNPQSFGYDLVMTPTANGYTEEWQIRDTGFTKSDAVSIIEKYQSDERWRQHRIIGTYHNYSRLRNLGLTHHDILQSTPSNDEFIKKAKVGYLDNARTYFDRLFVPSSGCSAIEV